MDKLRRSLFVLLLAAGLSPLDGMAGMLQVSTVMLELGGGESASSITLSNPGDQPLYGQVRLFRWDQVDGDDKLAPTQSLVASPQIIEVAPHASQLVRIVRIDTPSVTAEQSYRMIVDEIPQPTDLPHSGVMIRLRYALPVFVEPAGAAGQPDLSWHLVHASQGWMLRVDNIGKRRAQIAAIELVNGDSQAYEINKGLLGYALAGSSRQWPLSLPPKADFRGAVKVHAAINSARTEAAVSVEQAER